MSKLAHSNEATMLSIEIAQHKRDGTMEDMCRSCADDANTPWPEGASATYTGPCHWCGRSDVGLIPFAELEETGFEEVMRYA